MAYHDVTTLKLTLLGVLASTIAVLIVVSTVNLFSAVNSPADNSVSSVSLPKLDNVRNYSQPVQKVDLSMSRSQRIWVKPKSKPIWEAPSTNTKMPPFENFKLTKEMVQERVKDKVIIVTFANHAFKDFVLTWVKHLTDMGLSNLLVGALDAELLKDLYWKGIPVFDMGSHTSSTDLGWGSSKFYKMGREKVTLINALLSFGYEVLFSDTDVVWLKNPLPYLSHYPEADILTSSDQLWLTGVDDRLDDWNEVENSYNIGLFHWRPTDSTIKLAKEWKDMLVADDSIWDQDAFNQLLRKRLGSSVDDGSGLVHAFDGNLKLGILPASIFCNGHTYFVQAMYQQLKLEPYAVHTTFQYAGTEGKRHRLREAKLFYDPEEYYNVPGGFMTFKPSVPYKLLLDGDHNINSHFTLVNYQIKQIRTALAIASLLNRTLVMPPLWCRLDRFWYPHSGVVEGSLTRQPFICPLDHVFEVNSMLKEWPEEEFGPAINFREYSFFDNPAVSNEVKESWLKVQLCEGENEKCHASSNLSAPGIVRFPKRSNDEMFKKIFFSFKHVKVIEFPSLQDIFLSFTNKTMEKGFRNRMEQYVGYWCCDLQTGGRINYDMYWDEKPGWKPKPI